MTTKASPTSTVHTAGGVTHTLGTGTASGTLIGHNGRRVEVELHDVTVLPHIERNLISIPKLVKAGYGVYFHKTGAYIFDSDSKLVITGKFENDLFSVSFQPAGSPTDAVYFNTSKPAPLMTWHRRLGHLSLNALRWLAKHAVGIRFSDLHEEDCADCSEANIKRKPHPHLGNLSSAPGFGLHMDLDHADVRSIDQKQYSLTIVDDASRFVFCDPIRLKDDTKLIVQRKIALIERHTGQKVMWIRCDRGGEFMALRQWCESKGIAFTHSGAGEHAQNPVAERMHQNIQHKARAMMTTANWPESRWPHAYQYATEIVNVSPARANSHLTPYAIWHSKLPDYDATRTFGCLAVARKKPKNEKAPTIHRRGVRCVFTGLHPESKTYLLLRLSDLQPIDNYNVDFFEHQFPFYGDRLIPNDSSAHSSGKPAVTNSGNETANSGNSTEELPTSSSGNETSGSVRRSKRKITPSLKSLANFTAFCRVASPAEKLQALAAYVVHNADPNNRREAMKSANWFQWKQAEREELNSLLANCTWVLVDRKPEMNVIDTRWLYKTKLNPDGTIERYKCRLVARGFQEKAENLEDTYSSTLKMNSIRTVFAIAAIHKLLVHHLDIKTAFLYGKVTKETFLKQPPGYEDTERPNAVCRLIKSIYGLRSSPLIWLNELRSTLRACGFTQCVSDPCVLINERTGVITACYVDDLLLLGCNEEAMAEVKAKLASKYTLKDFGLCKRIVGLNVEWTEEGILLHSQSYIRSMLENFNMTECRSHPIPMNPGLRLAPVDRVFQEEHKELLHKLPYRALIGSLLYAVVTTRPDIAYAVSYLSRFNDCYTIDHWKAAKQVLRYLAGTRDLGLFFRYGEEGAAPTLELYSDADFAMCEDTRRSVGGTVVLLNGCVIGYSSRRHKMVTRSTCEAEYVQLSDSVSDSLWFSSLLGELGYPQNHVSVYEDNQSAIKLASTERITDRNRHIDIRYHQVREKVADGRVVLRYCNTTDMLADTMTKALHKGPFFAHRDGLGMRSLSHLTSQSTDQVGNSDCGPAAAQM